jgi:hypothetical protein
MKTKARRRPTRREVARIVFDLCVRKGEPGVKKAREAAARRIGVPLRRITEITM